MWSWLIQGLLQTTSLSEGQLSVGFSCSTITNEEWQLPADEDSRAWYRYRPGVAAGVTCVHRAAHPEVLLPWGARGPGGSLSATRETGSDAPGSSGDACDEFCQGDVCCLLLSWIEFRFSFLKPTEFSVTHSSMRPHTALARAVELPS